MPSYSVGDTYLENEILQAEGCRLVQLLYRSAVEAIDKARGHLRANEIQLRSREITKAQEIVNELAQSLDHSAGGDISQNLAELYDYVQRLLMDGNFNQSEAPLAEAQSLMQVLLDGWEQAAATVDPTHVVPTDPVPNEAFSSNEAPAGFAYQTPSETETPAWDYASSSWESAPSAWEPTPSTWEPAASTWESAPSAWEPATSAWQPAPSKWETPDYEYTPLDYVG